MKDSLLVSPEPSPNDSGAFPYLPKKEDNVTVVWIDPSTGVKWILEISHYGLCRDQKKKLSSDAGVSLCLCSLSGNKRGCSVYLLLYNK